MWTAIPSFEPSSVLYITHTYTSPMQELIMQGMQQKLQKYCYIITIFYSLQSIWLSLLIGLDS